MTGIPDDAVEALAVELLMQSYVPRDAVSEAHARNRWRLAGYGELRAAYRERARAGLAAAMPHLAAQIRADVAEEIAAELDRQAADLRPRFAPPDQFTQIRLDTLDWAAGTARLLRVPDCGDQYHGADGGPCSGCGFDAAAPADALTASQPGRGSPDGAPGGSSARSVALSGLQGHSAPTSNPTDITQED